MPEWVLRSRFDRSGVASSASPQAASVLKYHMGAAECAECRSMLLKTVARVQYSGVICSMVDYGVTILYRCAARGTRFEQECDGYEGQCYVHAS